MKKAAYLVHHANFKYNINKMMRQEIDLGRMANLRLVDKRGKELVELKLQVLA